MDTFAKELMNDSEFQNAMEALKNALDLANKELEEKGEEPAFSLSVKETEDGGIRINIGEDD